jgi:uncharacterized protein YndB with AHSA1/START domain
VSVAYAYRDLRVGVDPAAGEVELGLRAGVPALDAWRAISSPAQVRRWLGTLSADLRVGDVVRLDFGGGDFSELSIRRVEPPVFLEYDCRFLGIGPTRLVRWTIAPMDDWDCEIDVSDVDLSRAPAELLAFTPEWADDLARLARFLHTGRDVRGERRDGITVAIELPETAHGAPSLLEPAVHAYWLPVGRDGLAVGAPFSVVEGAALEIAALERPHAGTLRLAFTQAGRDEGTSCLLSIAPRTGGALLEVQHTGFGELPLGPSRQKEFRAQMVRTWVLALTRARAALSGGHLTPVAGHSCRPTRS